MNVDILGISELKWTETGEFNSNDHYIYYCGQESLRRNGVTITVYKRTWNARFMNQGKLEVVKQEMARVNIDIAGISELRWTGWVNLTEMTIISTTVGRNLLEEME